MSESETKKPGVPSERDPSRKGYSLEVLREAETVTTHLHGAQLEVQLGHLCNNRCVFCVSGQMTADRMVRPIEIDPVFEALESAAERGAKKVTILGGEPTIQKSFMPALQRAKALGFEEIIIFTNGVRGKNHRWIDDVLKLGDFTWRISVQGGNEEAHDRVTERTGSFARIVAMLEYLRERKQRVTANMCVNELSYESLPDFVELCRRYDIVQLHIDMFRPNNAGVRSDEYLQSILPRHSAMKPYIDRMLAGFESWDADFDINVGNYPYCQLPQWAHHIHHGGEETVTLTTGADGRLDRKWNKYKHQRADAVYAETCESCVFVGRCRGVPEKYEQYYGLDELRAVSRDELAAMDPQLHNFTLLVQDELEPLRSLDTPAGWRRTRWFEDSRQRRIELHFAKTQSDSSDAVLVITPTVAPPSDAPAARLLTSQFAIGVNEVAGSGQPIVEWAHQVFEEAGTSVRVVSRPSPESTDGAAEARMRSVLRVVHRLRKHPPDGWHYEGFTESAGVGGAARIVGPSGYVDVVIEPSPAKLNVRFETSHQLSDESARPVIEHLARAMRG